VGKTKDLFIRNLQSAVLRKGLNYAQLADLVGMSRSGLYKIVEGHREPDFDKIDKLAQALEIEAVWLFGGAASGEDPKSERGELLAKIREADEGKLALLAAVIDAILSPASGKESKPRRTS
jgi:transcriptional regulator with XRE-family HTH domain